MNNTVGLCALNKGKCKEQLTKALDHNTDQQGEELINNIRDTRQNEIVEMAKNQVKSPMGKTV